MVVKQEELPLFHKKNPLIEATSSVENTGWLDAAKPDSQNVNISFFFLAITSLHRKQMACK